MPDDQTESLKGRFADYTEDFSEFRVFVMEDNSDEEMYRFKLKRVKDGVEFDVTWTKKGIYCFGMWRMKFNDGTVVP